MSCESFLLRWTQEVHVRLLLVGDSHSQALWPRLAPWLESRGHTVTTLSHPGWSESRYMDDPELWARLADFKPDGVVVELGGNNRERGTAYRELIQAMVGRLEAAGPKVIWWVGPSAALLDPWKTAHEATAEQQAKLMPLFAQVRWLDSRPFTRGGQREDGVHFTRAGYDRWAAEIKAFLVAPVVLSRDAGP